MSVTSRAHPAGAAPDAGLQDEGAYYDTYAWGTEQPYQREVLQDIVALLPAEARTIADIGCGDGIITNRIAPDRFVVGVDTSVPALATVSRARACGSILELPFGDRQFDLVMANDVLEHLGRERREQGCRELGRIARDWIILTVPFLENLAASQRLAGGAFRHVNHHFEAMDLARLRGSFRGFSLRACIFSGVTWEEELDPVERLKVLRTAVEDDPTLTRRRDGLLALLDAQIGKARERQAAFLCANPDEIDGLQRRTEAICLFARDGLDWTPPPALRERAIDAGGPPDPAGRIDLTALDFRNAEALRKPSLPFYAPLPWWFCADAARSGEEGTEFVAPEAGTISVKFGFFAPLPERVTLRLRGGAGADGTLSLLHYDRDGQYQPIWSESVQPGPIDITAGPFAATVTRFGYLFEVAFTGARLSLREAWVDSGGRVGVTRPGYSARRDYLYRATDGLYLFVSRRIDAGPRADLVWFHDVEKRRAADGFRYFAGARDARAALAELELAGPDAEAALTARLAALEARFTERIEAVEANFVERLRAQAEDARAGQVAIEAALNERLRQQAEEALKTSTALAGEIARLDTRADGLQQVSRLHDDALTYLGGVTATMRTAARVTRPLRHAIRQYRGRSGRLAPEGVSALPPALAQRKAGAAGPFRENPRLPSTVTMLVADNQIDRRVLQQARTLSRQGVAVTVIAAPAPWPRDLDQAAFPEVAIVRIDTSRAAPEMPQIASRLRPGRDWQAHYFYYWQFLVEALKHPAEAYVAHDLPVLPAAIAAADHAGAAVLYDAHELYPEQLVFGAAQQQFYRDVEAEIIGHADAVSTVNLSIAEEMARRYGIPTPAVILNATDPGDRDIPVAPTALLRNSLGIGRQTRILLFQGGLAINRNLENLVASMAHVTAPDVVLVVMGPGDEKREELRILARSLGIGPDRLRFHEAVPQRVLLDYTASADAGIIPYPGIDINTTFCTPNKLFEFIAAGLPMVANDLPELRRFVADTGFGIVHPMGSAQEVAAAIDALFAHDLGAFRERLAAGASAYVWPAQEETLLALYRAAMVAYDRRMAAAG